MDSDRLDRLTLDRILNCLEVDFPGSPDLNALRNVYAAWCTKLPFDNLQKLYYLQDPAPGASMPGGTATAFFQNWQVHGTGGTCWSSANALYSLLDALGFPASRAIGTMLVVPGLPPNHGTVTVTLEGERYLVDTALLHGEPLLLNAASPRSVDHAAWGCRSYMAEGLWHFAWRPSHKPDGIDFRIDHDETTGDDYRSRYEHTRGWSPFNYSVYIRKNRGDEVISIAYGKRVTMHADGSISEAELDHEARNHSLVTEFGIEENFVKSLREDRPLPPPPGSNAALQAALEGAL